MGKGKVPYLLQSNRGIQQVSHHGGGSLDQSSKGTEARHDISNL